MRNVTTMAPAVVWRCPVVPLVAMVVLLKTVTGFLDRQVGKVECFSRSRGGRRERYICSSSISTKSDHDGIRQATFTIYYNDVYEVKLPLNHRFPMEKYRKVRLKVQDYVNNLLSADASAVRCEFRKSPLVSMEDLAMTHDPKYIQRFLTGDQTELELRNVGFPWSPAGVDRALSSTGGTVAAACTAVQRWIPGSTSLVPWSAHVAGGTHHAFYDRGEGFCVFSDIAVAANVVLQRFPDRIKRILILDLDVHQGNGNSVLFQDRADVFTFSMHCEANYFSEKRQSDLDVELPVDCDDETYLVALNYWLDHLRKRGKFDLIFFQAGVDVLGDDRLGRMALTQDGVSRRNEMVYDFAHDLGVPLVITMGGGYPKDVDWDPILAAHANVYIQAHKFLGRQSLVSTETAAALI